MINEAKLYQQKKFTHNFSAFYLLLRKTFLLMGKTDVEMHLEKLVQNIKNVRIARGYTFEYMSACLGITVSAYHKIEHHKTKLTIERLLHIAQILDIDVAELWSAPTKAEAPNEKTKKFLV